jgi:hypothetical protein
MLTNEAIVNPIDADTVLGDFRKTISGRVGYRTDKTQGWV